VTSVARRTFDATFELPTNQNHGSGVSDISQAKEPIIDESSVFLINNKKYAAAPKNRIILTLDSIVDHDQRLSIQQRALD
jgi:hypothetical protein